MTEGPHDMPEDLYFLRAVHAAAEHACRTCANGDPRDAYLTLAWGLRSRGIEPEQSSVYDAALLISRGKRPAILSTDPYAAPQEGRRRL